MSSYRWLVLQEILRALRNDILLSPEPGDTCAVIPPCNIVFRKVAVKLKSYDKGYTFEPSFPGIIVSTPFSEPFSETAGESAHDEYTYHFLCQIIDSDNQEPNANVQTYWKWQEQIVRLFQFNCPCSIDAYKVLMKAVNVDVVDETKWVKDGNFVAGVHLTVQVWMTRGRT